MQKVIITDTRSVKMPDGTEVQLKAGDVFEASREQADYLFSYGLAITESEHQSRRTIAATRAAAIDASIRASKAFKPKQDTSKVRQTAMDLEAVRAGAGIEYIEAMPALPDDGLEQRLTGSVPSGQITRGEEGIRDAVQHVMKASEPFQKTLKNGGMLATCKNNETEIIKATLLSQERGRAFKKLGDMIATGADFNLTAENPIIKAAGDAFVDSGNTIGVLNSGLTLNWNLGFLANQLAMINDVTTDISNTPAHFNQIIRTRYIKVPGVQLKTTTNSWSGGSGNAVDVNITMKTHAGVPIEINNNILGATARQLFNEQKQPQLYGLGEYIIYKGINVIFTGSSRVSSTDGSTVTTITYNPANQPATYKGLGAINVSNATLRTFVSDVPGYMDLAKLPGGDEEPGDDNLQRFAWVHTSVYANATADTNFVLNQSIWGAIQAGRGTPTENLLETGRFSRLGNIRFRKSQMMTDTLTTTGSGADGTTNAIFVNVNGLTPVGGPNAVGVGLAGTRNSLLFASRVPIDYTKVLPEIPSTAAVELVTEPRTGITFMVVKFIDHAAEVTKMRVQLMFDWAIGDERQGIPLVLTNS